METGGDTGPHPQRIDEFSGNAIFASVITPPPDIPDKYARDCPQCGRRAWLLSRHCWHCQYDFERQTWLGGNPAKLILLAVFAYAVFCAVLALR